MAAFKWGIIGPGSIAREFAEDLQYASGEKQVVNAVLSRSIENAREFAEEFNAPFFTDNLSRFITQADVDAVYIATPHAQHYQYTIACLERQIPVLCEKPLAINSAQVKEMMQVAAGKTFLMEAMWIRFLPSIHQVLSNLQKIGNITSIKADLSFRAPHDEEHARFFDPAQGGGSLLDLGIYPQFLSFLLLGKPCSIKAIGRLSMEGVDEACAVLMKYAGSQYAVLESSLLDETEANATIFGEKGYIKIFRPWNEKPEKIQLHLYEGEDIFLPVEWAGKGMYFEAEEVVRCVRSGKLESPTLPLQTSLDIAEIMDEIRNQIHVTYKADKLALIS